MCIFIFGSASCVIVFHLIDLHRATLWQLGRRAAFVFCFLGDQTASGQQAAGVIPVELLSLPKQIAEIPDCVLEYKITFPLENGLESKKRHRYSKQGVWWRDETFDEQDVLETVLSFDGVKYYSYCAPNDQLFVTDEPDQLKLEFLDSFLHSPMCHWAFPFFFRNYETFKMPDLSSTTVWLKQLQKFSISTLPTTSPTQKRFKMAGPDVDFEMAMNVMPSGHIEVPEYRLTNSKWAASAEKKEIDVRSHLSDWRLLKIKDSGIFLPMKIESGSKEEGVTTTEVIAGSIAPVSGLKQSAFQIPLISMKDLRLPPYLR